MSKQKPGLKICVNYNVVQQYTSMIDIEMTYRLELTKDTSYIAVTGELWGVSCQYLEKKLSQLHLSGHHTKDSPYILFKYHMGQVTKLGLSCYLVLLSVDSKTR